MAALRNSDIGLPQVVAGRKIRPISLAEAWIKLADKVAVAVGAASFRSKVEPQQLGAGHPDGVVAATRRMRRWAAGIEDAALWCSENAALQHTVEHADAAATAEEGLCI